MCTAWHFLCLQTRCGVWIEWVPSECNPADILSREGRSSFATTSGEVDPLLLPEWVNMEHRADLCGILNQVQDLDPVSVPHRWAASVTCVSPA